MTTRQRKIFLKWLAEFIWSGILLLMMFGLFLIGVVLM